MVNSFVAQDIRLGPYACRVDAITITLGLRTLLAALVYAWRQFPAWADEMVTLYVRIRSIEHQVDGSESRPELKVHSEVRQQTERAAMARGDMLGELIDADEAK